MRRSFRRTLATCLLASLALPAWAFGRPLELTVGRSEVIRTTEPILRVAISDPGIADVVVLPDKEVLINGKAGGVTNLMVWTQTGRQTYRVTVDQNLDGLLPMLAKVTGSRDLAVHNANGTVVLQGTVRTPKIKALAESVAATFAPKVISQLEVPPSEQIQVDIQVVELDRTAAKDLGITWGSRRVTDIKNGVETFVFNPLQAAFLEGGPMAPLAGLGNLLRDPLMARLDLMVRENKAKVLARPTLVANSGATAKFLAGGEIPIPVQQALGTTTILWKEYGIRLETEPSLLDDGKIQLKLKPEVSSLDFNNAITLNGFTVPALRSRRAETEVRLSAGESLALGGLLSSEDAHLVNKLPLLGDIPILGELFKSHQFRQGKSELLIIVTPRMIQASRQQTPGLERHSDEFRSLVPPRPMPAALPAEPVPGLDAAVTAPRPDAAVAAPDPDTAATPIAEPTVE